MDADLNKHSGDGRDQEPAENLPAMKPERLIDAARSYFSSDFSNSSRSDCPPAGSFDVSLRVREFPSEELRKHLFGCSECFSEYREAVDRYRETAIDAKSPSWRERLRWFWPVPTPAYSLLAAFILLAGVASFVLLGGGGEDTNVADVEVPLPVTPSTVLPLPAEPSTSDTRSHGAVRPPTNAKPGPPARTSENVAAVGGQRPRRPAATLSTVLIDLAGYSVLRADDSSPDVVRGTTLPPAVNRLRILLPEGSPRGIYRISVVDAFGNPLTAERAVRSLGKKLEVRVDTRKLSGRRCRLRISRNGDAPDYYPITVNGR